MYKNLEKIGKNYQWLQRELAKLKVRPEDALIVLIDGKGEIFCQKKQKNRKN